MAYTRKPQGVAYHPSRGRLMELKGYSLRIYWSPDMLDYLRRHYATTLNDELAGCLNRKPGGERVCAAGTCCILMWQGQAG
jgi:hypothetical protein